VEGENSSTEVRLLALKPGTGPAFNTVGTAAVKVAFYINVDVRQVSGFNAAGRDSNCFKDYC
jgi:hypothetical protein